LPGPHGRWGAASPSACRRSVTSPGAGAPRSPGRGTILLSSLLPGHCRDGPVMADVDHTAGVLVAKHLDPEDLRLVAELGLPGFAALQVQAVGPDRLARLGGRRREAAAARHDGQ